MMIINSPINSHTNKLFNSDKNLKFEDIIKFKQLKVIYELFT